ncbi:uncharacterized protein MYCFIDRAFT_151894 [Pseudocercospora fijiensis CIRAD86]|uniref:GST N-terminal domain-containing protein n=1 Tax=Pseudocercospora fijiensis (strain CIRAD86) TaxID=383855 RepID=M2ZAN4_PSEFD|nr:uncharacterized protein MYCFIDRAFT_151894 [Pseudocercospora fijiensis CIRAD86]EME86880.1 hypothetical protein MYCFIDRAFT_151894 [Pseudocercospora fijiensis CIRAD86]
MSYKKGLLNGHPGDIILFTYPESVFGRRMVRYLNLRRLPFSQIRVPPYMPRPILQERLGVNYRRIPIMAIGRDIYIDTRLMLAKLETFFPENRLGADDDFGSGVEDLLENLIIDGGPFWRTAGCIPPTAPLMTSEVWTKDRSDGSGGAFTKQALLENRSWSISQLRIYYDIVEKMLRDGRQWILGGDNPGLAEIHAGWVFDWGLNMAQDMGDGSNGATADMKRALSDVEFPKLHDWVKRFRDLAEQAGEDHAGGGRLQEGADAEDQVVDRILAADFTEQEPYFDESDVLGLQRGQRVTIAPVDFGFTHKDEGTLVGISKNEVVIEVQVPQGKGSLRLHYPRINFKILRMS